MTDDSLAATSAAATPTFAPLFFRLGFGGTSMSSSYDDYSSGSSGKTQPKRERHFTTYSVPSALDRESLIDAVRNGGGTLSWYVKISLPFPLPLPPIHHPPHHTYTYTHI